MMKLELPRGMRDLAPEEFYNINYIEEKFLETTSLFNFKFMEPSPLETALLLWRQRVVHLFQMKYIVLSIGAPGALH